MTTEVRGVVSRGKGEPVTVETVLVPDPGPGEALVDGAGLRRLPHRPALPRGRDLRRLPVPARARGGRHRSRRSATGVTDVEPGDFVILNWRAVCGDCRACRARPPLVLLQHPQRDPEDDAGRRHPALARRWASARSPRRRWSRPASAPRWTRRRRPTAAGLLGCGVMAGLGAAINTGGVGRGDSVAVFGCGGVGDAAIAGARPGRRDARSSPSTSTTASSAGPASSAPPTRSTPAATDPVEAIRAAHRRQRRRRHHRRGRAPEIVQAGVLRPRPRRHGRPGRRADPGDDAGTAAARLLRPRRRAQVAAGTATACPRRDFPMLIDLYRQGRLDLDRFVSETIAIDDVEDAFAAMHRGDVLRSVVVF